MKRILNSISISLFIFFSSPIQAHEIGEYYQGGVIFWIDKTESVERGLIAASSDQASNIKWATREYATGSTLDGLFVGKDNTKKIIDTIGPSGDYAAKIASLYKNGGYSDWYLPSKYELNLMFNQHAIIGEFGPDSSGCTQYWSSTEVKAGKAWSQSFNTGITSNDRACGIDGNFARVRAIRSFQEVHTNFQCSIVSGIHTVDPSWNKLWTNYAPDPIAASYAIEYIGSFKNGYAQAVFKCTVGNGSILVSSYNFVDNKTNQLLYSVLLKNETRYFYGRPNLGNQVGVINVKPVNPNI